MTQIIGWTSVPNLLAQESTDGGWANLLYLLLVVIIPALGQLGAWIRKKYGGEEEVGEAGAEKPDGKVVIVQSSKPTPRPNIPQARPLGPAQRPPVRPAMPAVPGGRPVVVGRPPTHAPPPLRKPQVPAEPPRVPVGRKPLEPRKRETLVESGRLRASPDPAVEARRRSARTTIEGERVMPSIRLGPLTPEDLRRAIVLREVLGAPLALRKPGEASWESA